MRVALICATIGQTRRGYEKYFGDLFRFTRDDLDIVLFKGAGESNARERVIPHLSRTGLFNRAFGQRLRYTRYRMEFASFAAAIWPSLMRGRFDLAHFIDPALGPHFARLRQWTGLKTRLLYSNAGPVSTDASRWADHVHVISPMAMAEARGLGMQAEQLTLVPMAVDRAALTPTMSRAEFRRSHGIEPDQFVILAIASVNRHHKRIHHLIEEVAGLSGNFLLWLDGSLHPDGDPSLIDLGNSLLGEKFRYSHGPSEGVPDLYGMADIFVSAATVESFGIAICEAMAAGLPVVVHDSEHFRWLVQNQGNLIDMTAPGALRAFLAEGIAGVEKLRASVNPEVVFERFGWPQIAREHVAMYRQVCKIK